MQDEQWLERRYWGDDLDVGAERALHEAGLYFSDRERALACLERAEGLAPGHLAVIIARYKFHLYRHELAEALVHALRCLSLAAARAGLPADWRLLDRESADFAGLDEAVRLYMFALLAVGYLKVRLGQEEGDTMLARLADLDPADRLGAGRLLELSRRGPGDGDDED